LYAGVLNILYQYLSENMSSNTELTETNTENVGLQNTKAERDNVLVAYQTLKFSKQGKNCFEIADIERKCLAIKYKTAKFL